jgi:hypothetical protein
MTQEVLTQTRVVGVSQARTVTAKIKGYQYPVELLGYRKQGGFTIVRVRVLPREDGFQPKPFRALGDVYPPFVYSPEGKVLKSMLEVK